jgi:hypothetical protein
MNAKERFAIQIVKRMVKLKRPHIFVPVAKNILQKLRN